MPPVETPLPASATVCAAGCDFSRIQAAIDDPSSVNGAIIEITDPLHTEAGIVIERDVIIRGLGADKTVVQAHETPDQAVDRVFLIEKGTSAVLEGMTVRHGKPRAQQEHGGGILNRGTLTVKACWITSNTANGGAGIDNSGALTLIDCTISSNTCTGVGPPGLQCGSGGGLKSTAGTLTVINSTVSANRAGIRSTGTGGGVRIGCKCTAAIANSTISGNQSARYGGGIAVMGTLRLINSTISNNTARGEGAGIYIRARLDFENTIVASNTGGQDCFIAGPGDYRGRGSVGVNRDNLVGDGSCSPDHYGDPMLGPLTDNGGATWTHALLPGSPAIDAVSDDRCTLRTDQRGLPRPLPYTSPGSPCDIGAFELQP